MGTESTVATKADADRQDETSTTLPRRLWQAPVFVVGIAFLAYVLITRLIGSHDPARQLDHDLKTVRHALDRSDGDLESALALSQRAVDSAPEPRRGEALYLLGSVHLFMAGRVNGEPSTAHYRLARKYLEEATRAGVPTGDEGKVVYRLGKAGYYTGDDLHLVIDRLQKTVKDADDQAEAYFLLCQSYLKLPQPDWANALHANEQLRLVPRVGEEVLSPARLQAGEILLALGKPDEARKVLEKVSKEAPAPVLARSHILRAQSLQRENRWADAAALWQAALEDSHEPPANQAVMRYQMGLCLARTDQLKPAIAAFEACRRDSKGDEGPAAALALAELHLKGAEPEKALPALAALTQSLSGSGQWRNNLANLGQVRHAFEYAVEVYRKAARTELAIQAAVDYERLAPPGRAPFLVAEAASEGARAKQEQARTAKGSEKSRLIELAHALYNEAATAYAHASDMVAIPAEASDYLWLAAVRAFDSQDRPLAAQLLERFISSKPSPEKLGEAWYLFAETRRGQGNESTAQDAYRECIKYQTPFQYRARYQLALIFMKNGAQDDAAKLLEDNLRSLRFASDADTEAQEKSLFALGDLLYHRRDYNAVVHRLEEALGRFPANPEATRARFELAESYYILSMQEEKRLRSGEFKTDEAKENAQRQLHRWLQKAHEEYVDLAKFLDTPAAAGHLTPEEAAQVPFLAAECKFNLGNYEEALQLYQKLHDKGKGIDRLNALGCMVRCLSALGRMDEVRQRLDEIRKLLTTLDRATQDQWKDWLATVSKPFAKP